MLFDLEKDVYVIDNRTIRTLTAKRFIQGSGFLSALEGGEHGEKKRR